MSPRDKTMIPRDRTAQATVAAGYALGLIELAGSKGADRGALLAAAGIAASDLADPDNRIPFARYIDLMRTAKALTGDPALALHFGEAVNLADVSIVGLIGEASPTMREAFQQLNRYVRLVVEAQGADSGPRFRMVREGASVWMVDTRADADTYPELTEAAFAQMVCWARRLGVTLASAVQVAHPAPPYAAEYDRIFQAPTRFGAPRNALRLNPAGQTAPLARLPRYVFGVLADRAEALLAGLETSRTTRGQVEALLLPVLHTGETGMDQVAAGLGLGRQTLLRRLKAEGVTYAGLLDALRQRLAMHYLAGRKVSVNETAYLLGFSDPAAFSRAFKRWTGSSPSSRK